MGKTKLAVAAEWDRTLFYVATLSLVFLVGCVVRVFAG
jgi:hypothetical protein